MMQIVPQDRLSDLFNHFQPSARTFFSGTLCATASFGSGGHLHLLRAGVLRVIREREPDVELREPTVLFFPRGRPHRFDVDEARGADLACAYVDLGDGVRGPMAMGLPEMVLVPLSSASGLAGACELLWAEAFHAGDGKQAALDHLFDYFLILILRHLIESGDVTGGLIAGLADPRLSAALSAMHAEPGRGWTLDDLAVAAGMSRTRFAAHFRQVVGRPAIDYLAAWRMSVAQGLLARGKPLKAVVRAVGYDSGAAFSRAFGKIVGVSPRGWMAQRDEERAALDQEV